MNYFLALVSALSFIGGAAAPDSPEIGKSAPAFTLTDVHGKAHALEAFRGRYVVLEWLNFDCPYVQKHYGSGSMQRLQKEYTDKGVAWFSVVTGKGDAAALAGRNEPAGGAQTAVLLDPDGTVGRSYGARTTPHIFIIDPEGKLIYMGGIDDKPTTRKEDLEGAKNYVAAALDESMAGTAVTTSTASPYGCGVKYP